MEFYFVRFQDYSENVGHFSMLRTSILESLVAIGYEPVIVEIFENADYEKITQFEKFVTTEKPNLICFEWLHDLPLPQSLIEILDRSNIQWFAVASISEIWLDGDKSRIWPILSVAHLSLNLKGILTWDFHLANKLDTIFPRLAWLPDFQPLEVDEELNFECCAWAKEAIKPIIGIGGQQYGYRGIDKILFYFFFLKKFSVLIWGPKKHESLNFKSKLLLKNASSAPRLFISDEFFEQETHLNHFYSHLDAFFIDGRRYPNPSGMANRSLAFGVPVLSEKGRGYYLSESPSNPLVIVRKYLWQSKKSITREINYASKNGLAIDLSREIQITELIKLWSKIST